MSARTSRHRCARRRGRVTSAARSLAPWILGAGMVACTQNHPYRMTGGPPGDWQMVPVAPIEQGTDYCRFYDDRGSPYRTGDRVVPSVEWVQQQGVDLYKLGYVEIDDHGHEFNPEQLTRSLAALTPGDDAGVVMVTFVHGWNHNAHPCDGNVRNFRLVLEALAEDERGVARREKRRPRHIRGIYVAWRGRSFRAINHLTFWARKEGAHRVGQRSAISVFTRIQSFAEDISRRAPHSKFVTIGHSFGAAVVHTALEARMTPELAMAADAASRHDAVPLVRGLGHLTVLLNPAFEAARYRHAHELVAQVQQHAGFHVDQRPVLLVLTTAKDRATRTTFSLGMRMRRHRGRFIKDERGDERREYLTAVGHHGPFHTPGVTLDCSERARTSGMSVDDTEFFNDRGNESPLRKAPDLGACSIEGWRGPAASPILSVYDRSGEVMSGHNDIFNPKLQALIWAFVRDVDAPPLIDQLDPQVPPRTMEPLDVGSDSVIDRLLEEFLGDEAPSEGDVGEGEPEPEVGEREEPAREEDDEEQSVHEDAESTEPTRTVDEPRSPGLEPL